MIALFALVPYFLIAIMSGEWYPPSWPEDARVIGAYSTFGIFIFVIVAIVRQDLKGNSK